MVEQLSERIFELEKIIMELERDKNDLAGICMALVRNGTGLKERIIELEKRIKELEEGLKTTKNISIYYQ